MTVRCICILIFNLMAFWPDWQIASSLSRTEDLRKNEVATHRILKSYDERKTGVGLNGISTIFQDRAGQFWFGNWFGAYVFDEHLDMWKSFTKEKGQLAVREVSKIAQGADNMLWFAPDRGWLLTNFDGESWRPIDSTSIGSNPSRRISALFAGRDGRVWIALEDVLLVNDSEKWVTVLDFVKGHRPLAKNISEKSIVNERGVKIFAALQDKEWNIWLATSEGVLRFDPVKKEAKVYSDVKLWIANFGYQDRKDRIWFADSSGHICVYDGGKDSWDSYNLLDHMPSSVLTNLKADPNGNYFIGVTGIYQDRSGQILIATLRGLVVYTESEDEWEFVNTQNSGLLSDVLTSIAEDHSGRIWIGTGKGIVLLEQ